MPELLGYQFDRTFALPIERYRQVATTAERDAIPSGKRWEGMLCYVTSDEVDYQLIGGVTNGDWTAAGVSGGTYFDTGVNDSDDITEGSTNLFLSAADQAKLDYITITQAVDLDALETAVAALGSGVTFIDGWDASSGNFPGGGTAAIGDLYVCTTAGTVDSVSFAIGDGVIAIVTNASTTTFSGNWIKVESQSDVTSVAGLTGAISASALRSAINVEDGSTADQTGTEIVALIDTELGTSDWQLPLTDEQVEDVVGTMISTGTQSNITVTYQDTTDDIDFTVPDFIQVYANLAALIAVDDTDLVDHYLYEVTDASGFTAVTSGTAWVRWLGTADGDEDDYIIVAKSEDAVSPAPIPLSPYADDTALFAGQGNQLTNYIYEVTDGSGFTGITSGAIWVKYLGTTTGDETDYTIISKEDIEGTAILSTGEAGGTKFLREDGDGTCSWQAVPGGGDMLAATYDPNTVSGDAFDMDNMVEGATNLILTSTERVNIASNDLSAKKWVIFGDSISDSLTLDYPANVISELGLTGTVTHGVASDRIDQQLADVDTLLAGDATYFDDFDIVSLLIGANDYNQDVVLGTKDDTAATASFAGYLKDFIETILTATPEIDIYIITLYNCDSVNVPYKTDNSAAIPWQISDLAQLINEICLEYSVKCIDLHALAQFNADTISTYTTDGIHLDTEGLRIVGKIISRAFMNMDAKPTPYYERLVDSVNGSTGAVVLEEVIGIACSDETSDLTVTTGVVEFQMPFAMTLTNVIGTVSTAPTGSTIIVDINDGGTTIMTTNKISIDATEKTSETAATAPTLTDTALAKDAVITIDIDQIGSTVAGIGLKVWLIGTRT